jgi:hypothetical protein
LPPSVVEVRQGRTLLALEVATKPEREPPMHSANSPTTLKLTPMTAVEAAALIRRLLGSYPSLNLHDPETYIANMVTLLTGYPLWAGEKAMVQVKRATKFPPTEAELYPALESQVKTHRYAQNWARDAERMVEGRALIAGPPSPARETLDELKARHGENWGISQGIEARPPPFRDLNQLRAEFGADVVDAVPNAPNYKWKSAIAPKVERPAMSQRSPEHGEAAE